MWGNKHDHTSPPPLTARKLESPAPLMEMGCLTTSSRYLSTSCTSSSCFPPSEVTSLVPAVRGQFLRPGLSWLLTAITARTILHPTPTASSAGELAGGRTHVALSGRAQPGPMGKGPPTRHLHASPTPGLATGLTSPPFFCSCSSRF